MRCSVHPEREAIGTCVLCGNAVCPECQRPVQGRILCPACFQELRQGLSLPNPVRSAKHYSGCLVFLIGLIPGLGHLFLGQIRKGLVLMTLAWGVLTFVLYEIGFSRYAIFSPLALGVGMPLLVAYSVFDSLHTARRLNAGEPVPDWHFPPQFTARVRMPMGTTLFWSLILGIGLFVIGTVVFLVVSWDWLVLRAEEIPPLWRGIIRNFFAVSMVLIGGYFLWRGLHSAEREP